MDYEYDESEEVRQVISAKKEKFRMEIRKSKNKEEFAMKRVKLMQDSHNNKQNENSYPEPCQVSKENFQINANQNQYMTTQKAQQVEKESFFSQIDVQTSSQGSSYKQNPQNYMEESRYSQMRNSSMKEGDDSIYYALEEFKNQYSNGNRKVLFDFLCSIRKKLTIASSEVERQYECRDKATKMNKKPLWNSNGSQQTMSQPEVYHHPVFSVIMADNQFLIYLLEILQLTDYASLKDLQNECIWILINLCAGKNRECLQILNIGILDTFKHLMENCDDLDILENVCWCLGNLAADDAESREKLFEDSSLILSVIQGFYEKIILKMLGYQSENRSANNLSQNPSEIENAQTSLTPSSGSYNQKQSRYSIVSELVFFLTNLIKKHPMPRIDPLRKILSILKELFFLDIPSVRIQIIKSFWVLLMKSETYLNEVLQLDIIRHIMPFLAGKNMQLIRESIDLFGVIVTSCDEFTRKIFVESKFQAYLDKALSNQSREIKVKGIGLLCKIIESSEGLNITAEIIYQERLVNKLLILLASEDFQIKIQILAILKEFLQSDMGVQKLIKLDYLQMICRLGRCGDPYIEKLVIQSLDLIFEYAFSVYDYQEQSSYEQSQNPILEIFFSNQGEVLLEQLQQSKSDEVYQLCIQVIQKYFND